MKGRTWDVDFFTRTFLWGRRGDRGAVYGRMRRTYLSERDDVVLPFPYQQPGRGRKARHSSELSGDEKKVLC